MEMTSAYTEEEIKAIVRSFITDSLFFLEDDLDLSDDASFMESGVIDSTGVLELIEFIEQRFEITVEEPEITPQNLDSLQNISEYVHRKLSGGSVE